MGLSFCCRRLCLFLLANGTETAPEGYLIVWAALLSAMQCHNSTYSSVSASHRDL